MQYISLGLKRDTALKIAGPTKHQYYYKAKHSKRGASKNTYTIKQVSDKQMMISNHEVIMRI